MMEPVSDRRPPITPQLALRVAIFGAVAFALFAIVFFRLWYLQVLSGEQYLAQANSNRVRALPIPAPRGRIVDRKGRVIVRNELAAVIEVDPS
jgi:penicillin-binding protein 2